MRVFSRVQSKSTKEQGTVIEVTTESGSNQVTSVRVEWDQTKQQTWAQRRQVKLLRAEVVENPPEAFLRCK